MLNVSGRSGVRWNVKFQIGHDRQTPSPNGYGTICWNSVFKY